MSRTVFDLQRNFTTYRIVLGINKLNSNLLEIQLNWHDDQDGGSRSLRSERIGDDVALKIVAGLRGDMPRWALADVLQEIGTEEIVSDVIRGV